MKMLPAEAVAPGKVLTCRRQRGRATAEAIAGLLALVFNLALGALYFGAVAHSFRRHGVVDGIVTMSIPPWAVYRAVEMFFDRNPVEFKPEAFVLRMKCGDAVGSGFFVREGFIVTNAHVVGSS